MILGVDPGARRVGLAIADAETRIAVPLEVVDCTRVDAVERIAEVVGSRGVTSVVVGRPVGLSGRAGPAVAGQQRLLSALRQRLDVEVGEYDERWTSVAAERRLRDSGARTRARRRVVDAVAAQVMLQGFLDATGA